jgi:hypothetical protein
MSQINQTDTANRHARVIVTTRQALIEELRAHSNRISVPVAEQIVDWFLQNGYFSARAFEDLGDWELPLTSHEVASSKKSA